MPSEDTLLPSAWVQLDAYDFGAHAMLRVIAELADGREILGYLQDGQQKLHRIPIPDRDPGSFIARHWRTTNDISSADEADEDDAPMGDGQKGDGFSNYEEYRGFRVSTLHLSPNPKVKDLFVMELNGGAVNDACRLIEQITVQDKRPGLKIWEGVLPEEWHKSHIMNLNRNTESPTASEERQHGIAIEAGLINTNAPVSYSKFRSTLRRPKNLEKILIDPQHSMDAVVISHEIGHAIGIDHHGEGAFYARWTEEEITGPTGDPMRVFMEEAMLLDPLGGTLIPSGLTNRIHVFLEDSELETFPVATNSLPVAPRIKFISKFGAEHSGEQDCVMRYKSASAVMPRDKVFDRVLVPQRLFVLPPLLCAHCRGTGENPKRFGHATLGDCMKQVCVRDSAPFRPPAANQCKETTP